MLLISIDDRWVQVDVSGAGAFFLQRKAKEITYNGNNHFLRREGKYVTIDNPF